MGVLQFEEMRQHGIQPNVYTYNALLKAECHVGNLTQVVQELLSKIRLMLWPQCTTEVDFCLMQCAKLLPYAVC